MLGAQDTEASLALLSSGESVDSSVALPPCECECVGRSKQASSSSQRRACAADGVWPDRGREGSGRRERMKKVEFEKRLPFMDFGAEAVISRAVATPTDIPFALSHGGDCTHAQRVAQPGCKHAHGRRAQARKGVQQPRYVPTLHVRTRRAHDPRVDTGTGLALASLAVNQQLEIVIRQVRRRVLSLPSRSCATQAAAVVLRKYVTEHWGPYFSQFRGPACPVEVRTIRILSAVADIAQIKQQIRHTIFQGLSDPNRKIRTAAVRHPLCLALVLVLTLAGLHCIHHCSQRLAG